MVVVDWNAAVLAELKVPDTRQMRDPDAMLKARVPARSNIAGGALSS